MGHGIFYLTPTEDLVQLTIRKITISGIAWLYFLNPQTKLIFLNCGDFSALLVDFWTSYPGRLFGSNLILRSQSQSLASWPKKWWQLEDSHHWVVWWHSQLWQSTENLNQCLMVPYLWQEALFSNQRNNAPMWHKKKVWTNEMSQDKR